MYRLNGFLLLTSSFLSLLGGVGLLWSAFYQMMQSTTPMQASQATSTWSWVLGQLGLSALLLFLTLRLFQSGVELLREKESILFWLPAESWPVLVGLVAIVAMGVQMSIKFELFGSSGLPKVCTHRQPMKTPYSGPEWVCSISGKWLKAGRWKDGKRVGRWLEWYGNGNKKWEGNYVQGKKHGLFAFYNPQGRQLRVNRYKNNRLHGPYILRYNFAGQTPIKVQGYYQKGQKCGVWVYWEAFMRQGLLQQKRVKSTQHQECELEE